ncbi:alpha/beta hydrolase family protein [Salipiger thiooxidans]|uniref:alpha/beta hydrolase n=1 Tax=Salipiger thiooxidans TaxID=282683 RepID=UPI001CD34ADD|nr:alpha/beta hydrolase [Salipiger thiooxidans]MCA0851538.1 alpha/beta hydrolase [Salipiger thiooxidans]
MSDHDTHSAADEGRRTFLKLTAAAAALGAGARAAQAQVVEEQWDKTFPKSDQVDHRKVSYVNRLGIELVADLYMPVGLDRAAQHAALVVGTPFGACKEQGAGVHAHSELAQTLHHGEGFRGGHV